MGNVARATDLKAASYNNAALQRSTGCQCDSFEMGVSGKNLCGRKISGRNDFHEEMLNVHT